MDCLRRSLTIAQRQRLHVACIPCDRLVMRCGYFPHPYAYHLTDRGSVNYQHDLYVVDYTVAQPSNGTAWQRGAVPPECYGIDDTIFADDFEG